MGLETSTQRHEAVGPGFGQGVRDAIPTLLGYWSIGFAAGVVEKTAGMSILEIMLLSFLLYAGSGQFIAAGMLGAGSPAYAIIGTIFFVNLRHLLMSAALSPHFRHGSFWKNGFVGILLTDETFGVASVALRGKPKASYSWMYGLNVASYLNWVAANTAGGLFGQWIPDPTPLGLDFALPGMFIGLLALQWMSKQGHLLPHLGAMGGAVLTAVAAGLLGAGSAGVILATIAGATAGMVLQQSRESSPSRKREEEV